MKENPIADKVLATIGAVLWSVQVIPQIIKSYRTKSTDGLSPNLMFIWGMATIFQGSYLVSMRSSIPLQVQPQAFGFFCVVSWAQCLYYGSRFSLPKTLLCMAAFYALFVGFEVGSVYALWAGEAHGVLWPKQLYGWITSALLALGLLPQYWEIYKAKQVVGISIAFMLVDIFGGIFSGVSLFFRAELDSTALVQYMLVVLLDGVVVLLKPVLDWRMRRIKGRDEEGGVGEADDATQRGDADEVVHAQDEKNEKSADTRRTTSASTLTPPFEDGRSFTVSSDETVLSVSDRHRVKE